MSEPADIVLGSGPSGVSVAMARLAKGKRVIMLDIGEDLEPDLASQRNALARADPKDWSAAQIAEYQKGQFDAPAGAIRKFGSDFALAPAEDIFDEPYPWLGLRASGAKGGLSNIWGASVLPSRAEDITDWPITDDALAPHYEAVAAFMPVAGTEDAIGRVYPMFSERYQPSLPPNPQAREILRRADQAPEGIHIGAARNAVARGCRQCGLCLHGCPWQLIWSAAQHVSAMRSEPNFTYRSGARAIGFSQSGERVQVTLDQGEILDGARLFVATGVLQTARLFLKSFPQLQSLTLLDSQHFFTPFLHRWRSPRDPETSPHTTLTGVFVEFEMPGTPLFAHAQLYSWNEQYLREMIANYGARAPFLRPLFERLSKRLVVAQTFLHSDVSSRIKLKLAANETHLSAEHLPNARTRQAERDVRAKLSKALRKTGLYALGFASHSGAAGSSFHVGGSLPMSANPSDSQTDPLGRLPGLSRIHAVDASVMSSVPASTITFTVMANAHRIGSEID